MLQSYKTIIVDFSKQETLADIMYNNPHLTREEILDLIPSLFDSVNHIDYLSLNDIIDKYEDCLSEQEIKKLKTI